MGKTLRGPIGLGLALLGLGATLYGAGTQRATPAHPFPPLLFGVAETCAATLSPLHRAYELSARAFAAMQRYPFAPAEGARAASTLTEAERCFERGQRPDDADRLHKQGAAWRQRLLRDYASHQLRLHHALLVARAQDAAAEGRALLALLAGQEGPYVTWLRQIERGAP